MKKLFACFSDGMGSLLSRIAGAVPGVEEVVRLLRNGRISVKESALSVREKMGNLLATNIDLGLYHFNRGNISDAKMRFALIRLVKPNLPVVHYNIGRCHLVLHRYDKAVASFEKALSIDHNNKEARYYLNKITAPDMVAEVPESIIKQHFNYTSEYFVEHWLIEKNYRGHEYIRSLVMNFFGDRLPDLLVLDLGCGTGICGQFLRMRDIGSHIAGVDISRRMLDIARQCFINGKRVYNELVCLSMRDFLSNNTKKFDVIIMAEVLHYCGELTEILKASSDALCQTGMLLGLVRECQQTANRRNRGYRFVKEGDFFCHSANYVQQTVEKLGLQLSYMSQCKIYGDKVPGLLFAVSKTQE
ncbi:MAG: methyltransferase [Aaplasma endosymbiont of Hyalomma asiaticum]